MTTPKQLRSSHLAKLCDVENAVRRLSLNGKSPRNIILDIRFGTGEFIAVEEWVLLGAPRVVPRLRSILRQRGAPMTTTQMLEALFARRTALQSCRQRNYLKVLLATHRSALVALEPPGYWPSDTAIPRGWSAKNIPAARSISAPCSLRRPQPPAIVSRGVV